ncbi:MAG: DNA translocase FtsK 4TM domain-containing protein, partial [Bdellovibrionales bacterium]|nr:DNA translocase FtsK 4TM domain-containing protein [Bdellovibrionales bacterium]
MGSIFKRFKHDIFGVIWLSIGLFVGLSLFSYTPSDPSLNSLHFASQVHNYCGYFGSFLADLLFQTLGIAAWLIVFIPLRVSYFYFRYESVSWNKNRVIIASAFFFTVSSLISLYFPQAGMFEGNIKSGGLLGSVTVAGLVSVFNTVGVSIILWSMMMVFLVFYTEKRLMDSGKWMLAATSAVPKFSGSFVGRAAAYFSGLLQREEPVIRKPLSLRNDPPKSDFFKVDESPAESYDDEIFESDSEHETEATSLISRLTFKSKPAPKRRTKIEKWELPKADLFGGGPTNRVRIDDKTINKNIRILEDKLHQFSVKGSVVAVKPGPAVTMFEFKPNADVKISKITDLADDLSLAMSAESVRIIAPLPGRDVVGIESSNPNRDTVYLKEIVEDATFWDEDKALPLALGKQADGEPKVVDLRKMPHLLVAGTTGSGKSVFVVSALTGLLLKHSPKTLRLILVDPKQVDLAVFHKVPHLIMPPIKEPKKAVHALKWAIREMEKRYRSMSRFGARSIENFNEQVNNLKSEDIETFQKENEMMEDEGKFFETYYFSEIPYLVIVVEEFGDLMAVDKSNVEQSVVRLAQMARACGIHLILAMQSPRKDVVTGLIKTNIPGRISFKVASKMDSRIILDESGAERLLARGDMLFLAPGVSKPTRHHAPWAPEDEINAVTKFWSQQAEPDFDPTAMKLLDGTGGGYDFGDNGFESDEEKDERYHEVLDWVSSQKEVSAS